MGVSIEDDVAILRQGSRSSHWPMRFGDADEKSKTKIECSMERLSVCGCVCSCVWSIQFPDFIWGSNVWQEPDIDSNGLHSLS